MLIPNLRAPIAMKLIYPANSHVEQQIDFLPKWIEWIHSNHQPAKKVQINLAWLLVFFLFISPNSLSPPISPKSTHSTLSLFFFLKLNEMLTFAPRRVRRSPCLLSFGGSQTGNPVNYSSLRMLWHIYCGTFDRNSGKDHSLERPFHLILHITMQLPSGPRDRCRASGRIKDTGMSLV